jgi:hypothetical protein
MVILNANAQPILDGYVDKYVYYRQKDEYGISSFWYWYYQVKNYINALDQYNKPLGDNLVFKMPQWGKIYISREIIDNEIFVVVTDFKFNQRNFKKWITHKSMQKFPYMEVGDAGYGYKIVQHDDTKKEAILTPQGKLLTDAVYDDIIGFYHHFGYDKNPTAIGFIGDRVYDIEMNGKPTLLKMSKKEFLNMKQTYEAKQRVKCLIRESVMEAIHGICGN